MVPFDKDLKRDQRLKGPYLFSHARVIVYYDTL